MTVACYHHDMTTTAGQYDGITYVVPCGGTKLDHEATAECLYTGQHFTHALTSVRALAAQDEAAGRAARILVLSARSGLVPLTQVLAPYDLRIADYGSVATHTLTAQALAQGIDWGSDVYAFLPRPYLARLDEALRELDVYVQDVYEATGGIGEQRRVLSIVARPPMVLSS